MRSATRLVFLLCLPFGFLGAQNGAYAGDIPVDTNADDNVINGNCTLREAIQAANTNSAVDNCPAGEAGPTVDTIDLSGIANQTVTLLLGELAITEEVTINGFALFRTTISGNNAGRVFNVSAHTTLNDVNVTNGSETGNGGGILVNGASNLTLNDVDVTNSTAEGVDGNGGGIYNGTGTLSITGTFAGGGSTLDGNVAEGDAASEGGGGIFNNGGTVTITDVSITNNLANVGALGNGGGIFNAGGTVTVNGGGATGGHFTGNMANRAGGGMESNNGSVNLNDVDFIDNTTGVNGGGLHVTATDVVTVDGGTFTGNTAEQEGGGLWNSALATMTIQNGTVIDGNTANAVNDLDAQGGGGVFNNGGVLTIDNATITNNTVEGELGPGDGGGGVFNDGSNTDGATVTITNTTIDDNTVTDTNLGTLGGRGGGILTFGMAPNTTTLNVTNGTVSGNSATQAGGGIETSSSKVTLTNVSVNGNSVGVNGGGLHVQAADTVTVDGGTFTGNTAEQEGGGLWNSSTGMMTIQNGTVIDGNTANAANDLDAQGGGGIFNNGGTVIIDGTSATVQITNNTSTGDDSVDGGGGLFNDARNTPTATMTITNANIAGNHATGASGSGGGILNIEGTVTLTDVTVSGNTANRAGNGIEDNTGTLFTINTSTISGNIPGASPSPGNGGGLHVTGAGTIDINTSTFSGNTATSEGGGLWNSATGSIDVSASTVVDNVAGADGGGVFNDGGTFSFDNTILGSNTAVTTSTTLGNTTVITTESDCSGAITSNDYNLIENTADCTVTPQANDITGQNPDLGPLQNNGGPTFTHLPNHTTSPVIDKGNSTGTDQRGLARMVDDGSIPNAGNSSDIGSVELTSAELPVELTSFEALLDGDAVRLTWTTASEADNAGFEVEHRVADAETFERLAFIPGAGTTLEAQSYSHRVEGLEVGRHLFRLKQIDFDGAFAYSPEVEVTVELAEAYRLSAAYPNPFNPQTRFTLAVQRRQDVTVEVYSALGQRVARLHEGSLAANETHRFTVEAGPLPSGTYLIRAQGETFTAVRRVTLVR